MKKLINVMAKLISLGAILVFAAFLLSCGSKRSGLHTQVSLPEPVIEQEASLGSMLKNLGLNTLVNSLDGQSILFSGSVEMIKGKDQEKYTELEKKLKTNLQVIGAILGGIFLPFDLETLNKENTELVKAMKELKAREFSYELAFIKNVETQDVKVVLFEVTADQTAVALETLKVEKIGDRLSVEAFDKEADAKVIFSANMREEQISELGGLLTYIKISVSGIKVDVYVVDYLAMTSVGSKGFEPISIKDKEIIDITEAKKELLKDTI